ISFVDPPTPEICPPSLHDALPISGTWQETGEQPSLTDGYDANSDLAVMSSTASWLAKWSGYAAREFKTKFIDPFPYILHNQARRSEEHTSELQSRENLVCRLLLEK